MIKPKAFIKDPVYDYHEVIEYIEDKYNIKTRGYGRDNVSHFDKWRELFGEDSPNCPHFDGDIPVVNINGEIVKITKEEYDKRFAVIHEQFKRYQKWELENPEIPYLDYWHWLLENDFSEISNGCERTLSVIDIISEDYAPKWVKDITQLIYDEFKEDYMNMSIEW